MADSSNKQYSDPGPLFAGGTAGYADSGAPGTPGIADAPQGSGGGGVIGTPVISAPYGSSQLPANMGHVPVTAGDTAGMADDLPAHTSGIMPGPLGAYCNTGAGAGSVAGPHHPNAGGGH